MPTTLRRAQCSDVGLRHVDTQAECKQAAGFNGGDNVLPAPNAGWRYAFQVPSQFVDITPPLCTQFNMPANPGHEFHDQILFERGVHRAF